MNDGKGGDEKRGESEREFHDRSDTIHGCFVEKNPKTPCWSESSWA